MSDNFSLFNREWAYLHRNLSGKYRVTKLSETDLQFGTLRGSKIPEDMRSLQDGIYVYVGSPWRVDLFESDSDATDFFLPNGAFTGTKYELISYLSDSRQTDSTRLLATGNRLPRSETHGLLQLLDASMETRLGMFLKRLMDTLIVSNCSGNFGKLS